jgi:hypothetical protein
MPALKLMAQIGQNSVPAALMALGKLGKVTPPAA